MAVKSGVLEEVWRLEMSLVRLSLLLLYLLDQVPHSCRFEFLLLLGFVEARQRGLEGLFRHHDVPSNKTYMLRQGFGFKMSLECGPLLKSSSSLVLKVVEL